MRKFIISSIIGCVAFTAKSQSWNITGNNNINPANHFLGTTNNQPVKFRINNIYSGEIDSAAHKTFLGYGAGRSVTTGVFNAAFGFKALQSTTSGAHNTAIGVLALSASTTSSNNIAIGYAAMVSNSAGNNIAVGNQSLLYNTSGMYNATLGHHSLYSNTTGMYNTSVGHSTLRSNTDGDNNIAVGYAAMYNNTLGNNNTSLGYRAMYSNTFGSSNTATGYEALYSNFAGYENTANGFWALYYNTTGFQNTASGVSSMRWNNTGAQNAAYGNAALVGNTSGYANTASGYASLFSNSTGSYNTGIGYSALASTASSQYNTSLGYRAGAGYNFGWNNTFLGANCSANAANLFNCIAIGQAGTNTASSQARIGNSATNSIGGYANWTNISDGRYKKEVKQNVKGLDFIMKLQPVTYHLNVSGLSKKLDEGRGGPVDEFTQKAIAEKEQIVFSGFVAQDVEKAAKEANYDFSGVDKPKNENDLYGLRYAEFVVPLVKAVQEQQEVINELKKQNALLQTRITVLEKNAGTKQTEQLVKN